MKAIINTLQRLSDGWAMLERGLLVVILLALILLAVLQIVLRNFFDSSLFWIDPFNRLLVLWLAILGAMVATREREHIAIDALRHYLKGRWLNLVSRVIGAFAALVCGLMSYHSARFVFDEYSWGTTTFAQLPAWPFELIMPIGFLIMAMRFAFSAVIPAQEADA